jgi:hypothetical protein
MGGPRTANILLNNPRKTTRDLIVHQILDILLEMKPGTVAGQEYRKLYGKYRPI